MIQLEQLPRPTLLSVVYSVSYALMTDNSGNDDCCGDCCASGSCEQEEPSRKEKRQTDNTYDILAAVSGGRVMNINQSDESQMGVLVSFSTPWFYRTYIACLRNIHRLNVYIDLPCGQHCR